MRSLLLATAAAVFVPLSAQAQTAGPDALAEVVVTATRIPAIVADTPGARVIDKATIEQRGAVFASDILADLPGLSVTRSGPFGGRQRLGFRRMGERGVHGSAAG
jgi:vitamin B12 transporter